MEEVIVSLAKEYLEPVFPVYKLKYFQSHVVFPDDDNDEYNLVHSCQKEGLFALKETEELVSYSCKHISTISQKAVDLFHEQHYLIADGNCVYENLIITEILRIA